MQDFTPLRKERPWDFNSFWGVLSLSYLNKWLCPHDLWHTQPHDKGLWNNFFHFLQAGWKMACTAVRSKPEVPDWDLALTLSSCSGDLTSPAYHFPHLFWLPRKGLFAVLQDFQIQIISKHKEFNSAFSHPSHTHNQEQTGLNPYSYSWVAH